jgi:hypothetical protein
MILSWFDAREANEFGASLADMLIQRTPADGSVGKRMVTKKHEAMLHQLEQHVSRFRRDHKLNMYKKAQLGNKFKWTLKDKGYDAAYVDQLTNWLMFQLQDKPSK